jgi:uncharacterized protein YecT (DUF1311 family)
MRDLNNNIISSNDKKFDKQYTELIARLQDQDRKIDKLKYAN